MYINLTVYKHFIVSKNSWTCFSVWIYLQSNSRIGWTPEIWSFKFMSQRWYYKCWVGFQTSPRQLFYFPFFKKICNISMYPSPRNWRKLTDQVEAVRGQAAGSAEDQGGGQVMVAGNDSEWCEALSVAGGVWAGWKETHNATMSVQIALRQGRPTLYTSPLSCASLLVYGPSNSLCSLWT